MAYRNCAYVAFHANGANRPGESDIDCYNLMNAWTTKPDNDVTMINRYERSF